MCNPPLRESKRELQLPGSEGSTDPSDPWRVFLEIGPGYFPTASESSRHYTGNDVYIGLEHGVQSYYGSRVEDFFAQQRSNVGDRLRRENIILAEGDGCNLYLPDASVYEVYLGNVVAGVPRASVLRMFAEAARVLVRQGSLVLDIGAVGRSDDFVEELQCDLQQSGFRQSELIFQDEQPERWQAWRSCYPSEWMEEHIFAITHKAALGAVALQA